MSFDRQRTVSQNSNDCAIAALSVYYGIPYDEAFEILKPYYRKTGTNTGSLIQHLKDYGSSVVAVGKTDAARWVNRWHEPTEKADGMTLATFCKKYPKGTYYVLVKRHAVVVKDGVVFDTINTTKNKRVFAFANYDKIG